MQELHDKHLLAEYRELPRVFKLAHATYVRGEQPDQHLQMYTLGKGHVKFFYTRLWWLDKRFNQIYLEMRARDWCPTPEALAVNRQRIADRKSKG